ncbi:hypothetical protein SCHPADRAFT_837667 [Schizopora paradoxa]|uniref:CxC2-like cysteine cluster KDZ transposase-associated domain-containing protein n=1 Tax=Schizopora paradoxa TaxID=27342 RepID=A0A0H2R5U6_9AGAM|nr:hypothetical protein SCHPADRAFT_837667 [Schizopora paradoxa]
MRDAILDNLLCSEALPDGVRCFFCGTDKGVEYKCVTCIGRPVFCQDCCVKSHVHNPFHQIHQWMDEHFKRITLRKLGLRIRMGHHGSPCPEFPGNHFNFTFTRFKDDEMVFVDKSGVWTFPVSYCNCITRKSRVEQILDMGLYPGSFKTPKTAFSMELLDYFYFDLMECHTPASNFFSKLRRLTNNVDPKSVTDRYRELMVAARQWNDLQAMKWAGVCLDPASSPGNGRLALFCAPCPQPGVNLPDGWEKMLIENPYVYRRQVNPDGNFGAPNMKTKKPEKDVSLTDGDGSFVAPAPYDGHLKATPDVKERSTCSNLKAVSNANANRKELECTGIGGCVCARHGCVIPHSVVDFQKGEQQKNMDYCISNALSFNSEGLPEAAVIYDLACQWGIHFVDRMKRSTTMSIPPFERLITAVGKFHLGSHVDKCFYRHSLNFVEGTGQVDGEIIETLWSGLNPISAMARSMTKAHRREVLDDAMRDWNWKKLTGIISSLATKWEKAVEEEEESRTSFQNMTSRLEKELTDKWEDEETEALEKGGDALAIYGVRHKEAPSMAEIRLELAKSESSTGIESGATTWLVTGMNLQEALIKLSRSVAALRGGGTVAERTKIEEQRRKLRPRVTAFQSASESFYSIAGEKESSSELNISTDQEIVADDPFQDSDDEDEECVNRPENVKLKLPSVVIPEMDEPSPQAKKLAEHEINLRKGQANDALRGLRVQLGYKALLYLKQVRKAPSYAKRTRAWDNVNANEKKVDEWVSIYHLARSSMVNLGASEDVLAIYQQITPPDLKIPKDIYQPNRPNQRSEAMSWIWQCRCHTESGCVASTDLRALEVYRVNWLRGKAHRARWQEEKVLVLEEMQNTIRWFQHRGRTWEERKTTALRLQKPGHASYARKQIILSNKFLTTAQETFRKVVLTKKKKKGPKQGPQVLETVHEVQEPGDDSETDAHPEDELDADHIFS